MKLTGDLRDPAWEKAEVLDDFVDYREQDHPARARTSIRLLYDTRNLYLGVVCDEPGISEPKSTDDTRDKETDRWPPGYSIEVFLRPDRRRPDYYQLAAGPFGGRYDSKGKDSSWNGTWHSAAKRTPNGWTLEMAVPFSDFGVTPPKPGESWGINICRNGAAISTWVPVGREFHRPDRFGLLVFGEYRDWWKQGFADAWRNAFRASRGAIDEKTPGNTELINKLKAAENECQALEQKIPAASLASRSSFLAAYEAAQKCLARFPPLDEEIDLTRIMTSPSGLIDNCNQNGQNLVFGNACRLANGNVLRIFYVGYAQVSWRDIPEDMRQFHSRGGKILAVRSIDGGKTWGAPITVVDDGNDNRAPMLAEEPNGTLVCHFVSLSTRPAYAAPSFVRSYDNGLTWEKEPVRITAEPYAFTASQVSGKQLDVEVGERCLAALGPVGEIRWGHWQFPILSKLRDGRLLLIVQVEDDSILSYGKPGKPFISRDSGKTWAPADLHREGLPEAFGAAAFNPVIPLPNGDLVAFPAQPNIAKKDIALPAPIATIPESYDRVISYFRAQDLPRELSVVKMLRLPRGSNKWLEEEAFLDIPDRVVGCSENEGLIPRPMFPTGSFARADDGSFLFVAPMRILEPDGSVGAKCSASYCLRSTDNGATWKLQGRVAYNPYFYHDELVEPDLCATANGTLVCVLRTTDNKGLGPMLLTTSHDSGKTWSALRLLENFGVVPRLLTLENGVTVLSYGRPGVRLLFSADGGGRCWEHPTVIMPGPSMDKRIDWYSMEAESCGNNSNLVPLGPDKFLMAYSDFTYKDAPGNLRKAIYVREVRVHAK